MVAQTALSRGRRLLAALSPRGQCPGAGPPYSSALAARVRRSAVDWRPITQAMQPGRVATRHSRGPSFRGAHIELNVVPALLVQFPNDQSIRERNMKHYGIAIAAA